jgi:hypothetical protein
MWIGIQLYENYTCDCILKILSKTRNKMIKTLYGIYNMYFTCDSTWFEPCLWKFSFFNNLISQMGELKKMLTINVS